MKTINECITLLREFKRNYAEKYNIKRIGIFGSVARGEQTENSDIDIYYESPPMGLSLSVRFIEDLEKLFGTRVDVIRKHNNLKPYFLQHIEKEVIYA